MKQLTQKRLLSVAIVLFGVGFVAIMAVTGYLIFQRDTDQSARDKQAAIVAQQARESACGLFQLVFASRRGESYESLELIRSGQLDALLRSAGFTRADAIEDNQQALRRFRPIDCDRFGATGTIERLPLPPPTEEIPP